MTTPAHVYGCTKYYLVKGFHCSLECELEDVRDPSNHGNWTVKKDGSLRNHGYEYISVLPLTREQMIESFTDLHKWLTFYGKDNPFSSRTSTHVHVNVQGVEMEHIKNMLFLYALFEPFFFMLVKPERRDNIHCVTLTDTYLPKDYGKAIEQIISGWHKYTALNLTPVVGFGSVEFRHLHGTKDVAEVATWLHVLENLWKLCQKVTINPTTLCSKTERETWFDTLFFPSPQVMEMRSSMDNIIGNTLIDVKLAMH